MINKVKVLSVCCLVSLASVSNAFAGQVVDIIHKGSYTIYKCSVGNNTEVFHDSYGKCSDNYDIGSYDCSYVHQKAKDRCQNR